MLKDINLFFLKSNEKKDNIYKSTNLEEITVIFADVIDFPNI